MAPQAARVRCRQIVESDLEGLADLLTRGFPLSRHPYWTNGFARWRHLPQVEADSFEGLLVEYVEKKSGQAIIRGLRAVSDFEFEFQLALMNRKLNERIETIFMMPKDTYTFLSSRIVKEIARLGGDVSAFVPAHVQVSLLTKLVAPPA